MGGMKRFIYPLVEGLAIRVKEKSLKVRIFDSK